MALLNKYTWVVSTLLRVGDRGLSLKELNEREYFSTFFGVVHTEHVPVERIVIRAMSHHHCKTFSLFDLLWVRNFKTDVTIFIDNHTKDVARALDSTELRDDTSSI